MFIIYKIMNTIDREYQSDLAGAIVDPTRDKPTEDPDLLSYVINSALSFPNGTVANAMLITYSLLGTLSRVEIEARKDDRSVVTVEVVIMCNAVDIMLNRLKDMPADDTGPWQEVLANSYETIIRPLTSGNFLSTRVLENIYRLRGKYREEQRNKIMGLFNLNDADGYDLQFEDAEKRFVLGNPGGTLELRKAIIDQIATDSSTREELLGQEAIMSNSARVDKIDGTMRTCPMAVIRPNQDAGDNSTVLEILWGEIIDRAEGIYDYKHGYEWPES